MSQGLILVVYIYSAVPQMCSQKPPANPILSHFSLVDSVTNHFSKIQFWILTFHSSKDIFPWSFKAKIL
jgi:hypothetical protein